MLKKLRDAYISHVVTTRQRFKNFLHWSAETRRLKKIYLEHPTRENKLAYLRAKKIRAIRLRTFRRSRIERNEAEAEFRAKKKLENQPLRLRALAIALDLEAQGIVEQGGNNVGPDVSPLIREGGGIPGQAWCGWFCSVVYKRAGSKLIDWHIGAVRLISLIPGVGIVRAAFLRAGNLVRYKFDHVGIFICWCDENGKRVPKRKATHIKAVEGNTGSTGAVSDSASGQDGVKIKIRSRDLISDGINIPR